MGMSSHKASVPVRGTSLWNRPGWWSEILILNQPNNTNMGVAQAFCLKDTKNTKNVVFFLFFEIDGLKKAFYLEHSDTLHSKFTSLSRENSIPACFEWDSPLGPRRGRKSLVVMRYSSTGGEKLLQNRYPSATNIGDGGESKQIGQKYNFLYISTITVQTPSLLALYPEFVQVHFRTRSCNRAT